MIREGDIHLTFAYAAGRAGSRFLAALRDGGVITGSRCAPCNRIFAPARSFCPTCGEQNLQDATIGPGGIVEAWTEVPGRGVFGLVHLDGADTAMVHRLLAPADELFHGARVRARFAATTEDGQLVDLVGFELAGAAS